MVFEAYQTAIARRDGLPLPDPFGLNNIGERFGFRGNPDFSHFWANGAPPPPPAAGNVHVDPATGAAYTTQTDPSSTTASYRVDPAGNVYSSTTAAPGYPPPPPVTGYAPPPSAGYPPYGPPPTAPFGAPGYGYGVPPIPPMPPMPPVPRNGLPTGAIVLIGLGFFALLGSMRSFAFLEGEATGGIFLIGLSLFLFWRRFSVSRTLYPEGSSEARWNLLRASKGAGVVFIVGLLTLLQGLHVVDWEYSWPILLIFLGVFILLERVAFNRMNTQPYPPMGYPGVPMPPAAEPVVETASPTSILPKYTRPSNDLNNTGRTLAMASTPPNFSQGQGDPNAPYDPTNVNDPRYDRNRDPRFDPRWQKAQQKFYRDQQRSQQGQDRAAQRAQAAAFRDQTRAQREQWKMYWRAQRRTSLIGPLLLITVGVVFFLLHTGRISTFVFLGWYSHWWPLLLIAIGVLRLAEWAIDRARQPEGAPAMRYSVGGGVVFAVIVLAGLGLVLHAGGQWRANANGIGFVMPEWTRGDMNNFFGEKHEEDAPPLVQDIAATGLLSIDNPHGDVTVTGTSDDGKVHLSEHKQVFVSSDSLATSRLRDLTTTLDGTPDNLMLRVPSVEAGSADLTLLVPATVRVVVNSNRGDVHVSNLKSPLSVTANNGEVEIAAITSPVQVHVNNRKRDLNVRSVTGDVTIDGNGDEVTLSDITGSTNVRGDFYGGGHLQRVSGSVEYHSSRTDISLVHLNGELELDGHDLTASEVVGPMLVNTRSRNINLDKVTGDVKVVNNHGDVDVHMASPAGSLTVDNQNGNVNVTLPERAKFTLTAETSDGDAHSDFSGSDTHGGRGILSGAVNGGGVAVRLNTSHGDINVSHNSMGTLPVARPSQRISTFSSPAVPTPPDVPDTKQMLQMQRDAMATAAAALHQSAEEARQNTRESTDEAKQRAKEAMNEARQAMKDAQEKQREAARLAREAARPRTRFRV